MSGSAIMMMIIGIVIIWGGLVLSIANLFRKRRRKSKTSAPFWCRCFFCEKVVLENFPETILQLRGIVKR